MKISKRSVVLTLVVVLSISSLGVLSANAASVPAEVTTRAQSDSDAPWLGVQISDAEDGAQIEVVVADSPADAAGLTVGDIITAVDDTAIESAADLVDAVQTYAVGDEIALTVLADGAETTVSITLAARPDDYDTNRRGGRRDTPKQPRESQGRLNMFGIEVEATDNGLLITSLDDDGFLAELGLQAGDLITAVNGEPVTDWQPRDLLSSLRDSDPVTLTVERDGETIEVELDVADLLGEVIPFTPGDLDALTITARPAQLGVYYQTITADLAAEAGLDVANGALIDEVIEDSPAAEAGLQAGDIVLAVDGDVVDEERTLPDRLYAYEEGDVVTLTVLRDGDEIALDVTLGPRTNAMFGGGRFGFDQDFMDNHPFMHDFFDGMPDDGFHFHFGPGDSTPDDSDAGTTDDIDTNA